MATASRSDGGGRTVVMSICARSDGGSHPGLVDGGAGYRGLGRNRSRSCPRTDRSRPPGLSCRDSRGRNWVKSITSLRTTTEIGQRCDGLLWLPYSTCEKACPPTGADICTEGGVCADGWSLFSRRNRRPAGLGGCRHHRGRARPRKAVSLGRVLCVKDWSRPANREG
jgi:hypothetical protein